MRNIIFAILLLFSFTLVGCKKEDNRPPLVRANELLRKNHLPEWPGIDSIYGYEDAYNSMLIGDRLAYGRDSLRKISYQRELTAKEKQEMRDYDFDSHVFLQGAESKLLEHQKNGDKEELIGYGSSTKTSRRYKSRRNLSSWRITINRSIVRKSHRPQTLFEVRIERKERKQTPIKHP